MTEMAGDMMKVLKDNSKLKSDIAKLKNENAKQKLRINELEGKEKEIQEKESENIILRKSVGDLKTLSMTMTAQNANLEKEVFELKQQIEMDMESRTSGSHFSEKPRYSEIPDPSAGAGAAGLGNNNIQEGINLELKNQIVNLSSQKSTVEQKLQELNEINEAQKRQIEELMKNQQENRNLSTAPTSQEKLNEIIVVKSPENRKEEEIVKSLDKTIQGDSNLENEVTKLRQEKKDMEEQLIVMQQAFDDQVDALYTAFNEQLILLSKQKI